MENFQEEYIISKLITKEIIGEITSEEAAIIQEWLGRSTDNRKLYESIKRGERRAERDDYVDKLDIDHAWEKLKSGLIRTKNDSRLRIDWISRVAAVLIIGLLASAVYFISRNKQKPSVQLAQTALSPGSSKAILLLDDGKQVYLEEVENDSILEVDGTLITNIPGQLSYVGSKSNELEPIYNEVKVPRGGEYRITLSDGTKVWLNSESQIKYPVNFDDKVRKVWVEGEVYFDVEPDKNRPFVTEVRDVEIEVLGTEFNVEAYGETNMVSTTLVEGSVKLTKDLEEIIIMPNQQAVIFDNKKKFLVSNVDARAYALWKEGIIFCEGERLEVVMNKLARWYDANLFYMNPSLKNKRFSIEVKRYQNIESVLDILSATNKVRFEVHQNNITIME